MRKLIPLLEACNFTMGQSPSSDTYNTSHDGMPFYQGNSDFGKRSPAPRVWCSAPKKTANEGDILISVRAPIGAINIASERCCIGRGLAAIGPLPDMVARDYLEHYLRFRKPELERQGTGSTFKAVGKKVFAEMTLPIVPMEEQTGIARRLGGVIELKEEALSQIEELDELVKSRFVEMFGDPIEQHGSWAFDRIDAFCDVITGNTPSRNRPEYYGDGIEWIKTDNITEAAILTEASERLSEEGARAGRTVPAGSVLMACIAGSVKSIGKVAIANRPVAFNQQINALVPHEGMIKTEYLLWMLRLSKDYLCSDINMQLKGILNKTNLSRKVFSVPPLSLQQEFVTFVRQVDKLKFETQQAIDKLQMLYDSLAQEYFGS